MQNVYRSPSSFSEWNSGSIIERIMMCITAKNSSHSLIRQLYRCNTDPVYMKINLCHNWSFVRDSPFCLTKAIAIRNVNIRVAFKFIQGFDMYSIAYILHSVLKLRSPNSLINGQSFLCAINQWNWFLAVTDSNETRLSCSYWQGLADRRVLFKSVA